MSAAPEPKVNCPCGARYPMAWEECPDCSHPTPDNILVLRTDNIGVETMPEATTPANLADPDRPAFRLGPRGGVIAASLAEHIRDDLGIELGEDGRLWRYHHGVYRPDGDPAARARARTLLGDKFTRNTLDEVLSWLRSTEPKITGQPNTRFVNCRNGLIDWRTGELHPHDPEVRSVWQVPIEYRFELAAEAGDAVLSFLETVLPADSIEMMLELIGYCLYPGNPLRRAVLLLGAGKNGKSTLLSWLREFIGPEACSAVPLQTMAENRFAVAELYGKAANIAGDLDARAVKRTDVFKVVTGGDEVHAERKYGAPFSFRPWALPLFSANEAPLSSDQTEGWFDRWLVIPFEHRITEAEMDPHLLDKLTTPTEMQALLVLAIDRLRTLMERGRFDPPASIRAAATDYRERLDTVAAFVSEHCTFDADLWLPRPELYRRYRDWATDGGRLPLSAATFNEHLTRHAASSDHPIEVATRKGTRGFSGIGWLS